MRSGGFPCRAAACDQSFTVKDQNSMQALAAASTARTDHEIAVHGYHHVVTAQEAPRGWVPRVRPPKPVER
jgi:hypothetical protein